MPYIKKQYRNDLDSLIDSFADKVISLHKENPQQTRDGLLNYSITRFLNKIYPNANYHEYNEIIGMLTCCSFEYYRKRIAPYEDLKETENGEVPLFDDSTTEKSY